MSPDDRADLSNGVWLCQSCAKQVDDDTDGYTAARLRDLRKEAEAEARDALPGGLARSRDGSRSDVLGEAFDLLGSAENWRASDGEEKCFYCVFRPEFTVREGDQIKSEFVESWMSTFPQYGGHSYRVLVFWNMTPLHSATFVACDGLRYQLPLPHADGKGGWYLRKDSIAYRIARLYRQYMPLDATLRRCGIKMVDGEQGPERAY
jgi:hypothetical protein